LEHSVRAIGTLIESYWYTQSKLEDVTNRCLQIWLWLVKVLCFLKQKCDWWKWLWSDYIPWSFGRTLRLLLRICSK